MKSHKVDLDSRALLDPHAAAWKRVEEQVIALDLTPVENLKEISPYIVATADMKKFGKVREIRVKTVHNGRDIFFRLEWHDANNGVGVSDPDSFADACGILFSMGEKPPPRAWPTWGPGTTPSTPGTGGPTWTNP